MVYFVILLFPVASLTGVWFCYACLTWKGYSMNEAEAKIRAIVWPSRLNLAREKYMEKARKKATA